MKVVTLAWGLTIGLMFFACGGKVEDHDAPGGAGAGGTGGASTQPVACPADKSMNNLSKLQNKACKTLYDTCGPPGACQYGCLCLDLGADLQWSCGVPCFE